MISISYDHVLRDMLFHNYSNHCQFYVLAKTRKAELLFTNVGQTAMIV